MCGIIGIVSQSPVSDRLVEGLKRMEYRGYDSAGVCTLNEGAMIRRRAQGKLANLVGELAAHPAPGSVGIAHTRWATHGAPTASNAHPHATAEVALVHNGIIENYKPLREELLAEGRTLESETDSEVVAHLISREVENGASPEEAVATVLPRLRGAFSLALAFRAHPGMLIGARLGSPLVVGYGEGEMFLGSDALALASLTQRIAYLEEGDWVVGTRDRATIRDFEGEVVERPITTSGASAAAVEKGNYRHYMQKEIFEQPTVVAQTLGSYLRPAEGVVALPQFDFDLSAIRRVTIVACGTSFYAGMVAKYWFEQFARVPVDIDVASEFRYREPVLEDGGLALFISQSGETADTLAALRHCKRAGQTIAVVVNVPTSSMAREADLLLPTHAGPEIGVASTKAFTCQLAVLAALAANWTADPAPLVALVDAWEEIAVAEPRFADAGDAVARARGVTLALCAGEDEAPAHAAARVWTLATLAEHAPDAAQRARMRAVARLVPPRRLPRALRRLGQKLHQHAAGAPAMLAAVVRAPLLADRQAHARRDLLGAEEIFVRGVFQAAAVERNQTLVAAHVGALVDGHGEMAAAEQRAGILRRAQA